jgi:hypothetical protein
MQNSTLSSFHLPPCPCPLVRCDLAVLQRCMEAEPPRRRGAHFATGAFGKGRPVRCGGRPGAQRFAWTKVHNFSRGREAGRAAAAGRPPTNASLFHMHAPIDRKACMVLVSMDGSQTFSKAECFRSLQRVVFRLSLEHIAALPRMARVELFL